MPRGRRRASGDVNALEDELQQLRDRQAALREQIRRLQNSEGEIRKLEEKLTTQFGNAKWTVRQIKELRPDWDEQGFYASVEARKPTPRGRRPRSVAAEEE